MNTRLLRWLPLVLAALLIPACGPEAPPRATLPPTPAERRLRPSGVTVVPAPTAPADATAASVDPRSLGDPHAPITVYAFSDFQCPFCASFARETMPQIKAQYIDTGKVYFIYRDLPLSQIHPGAILAAHTAGCAAEQGAFWPMHDRIFQGYEAREWERGGAAGFPVFLGYARELGLDEAAVRECIQSNRRAPLIEDDVRAAHGRGIQTTPTFLINGQPLIGAQPFSAFQQAFDQILAGDG